MTRLHGAWLERPWGRMRVWTSGRGPVVLALHGLGGSGRYWRGLADRLGDDVTLVAPDLAGFGSSETPAVDVDRSLLLGDVDAIVAGFGRDEQLRGRRPFDGRGARGAVDGEPSRARRFARDGGDTLPRRHGDGLCAPGPTCGRPPHGAGQLGWPGSSGRRSPCRSGGLGATRPTWSSTSAGSRCEPGPGRCGRCGRTPRSATSSVRSPHWTEPCPRCSRMPGMTGRSPCEPSRNGRGCCRTPNGTGSTDGGHQFLLRRRFEPLTAWLAEHGRGD